MTTIMVAKPEGRRSVQAEIEYDVVALGLTATAIAIIKDATGVTIDPKATNFRQVKEKENFKRREKRLAQNAEWRPTGTAFDVA